MWLVTTGTDSQQWTRATLLDAMAHGVPAWVVIQHDEDHSLEVTMANSDELQVVTDEERLDELWPTMAFAYTAQWRDSLFRCNSLPDGVAPMNECGACQGSDERTA